MSHRIEISLREGFSDPTGSRVASEIVSYLGYPVTDVRVLHVYTVNSDLNTETLSLLAAELCDPVNEISKVDAPLAMDFDWLVEVGFRPGVTDNAGRTATESARMILKDRCPPDMAIFTSKQYLIKGSLSADDMAAITTGLLCNTLIQRHRIVAASAFDPEKGLLPEVPEVTELSPPITREINLEIEEDALLALSRDMTLALTLDEMKIIRDYYRDPSVQESRTQRGLPRNPTDVEIEVLAQTWSEHCKHKIFNARIEYRDGDRTENIDSLYRSYIKETTHQVRRMLGTDDYCLSVFKDNAGVWKYTDEWNLVFKVETHNSPSALDPYGGALTGIVGVNRDPHGTGKGSRLFCNTNVFCLADPFYNSELPPRLLHPRRVMEGVREGVEHGGNKSGIPTVNGSLVFEERFLGKPLVFCGTGGIMPAQINGEPSQEKQAFPGDRILMVGGRIGKDGIHGATFSSEELHEGSPATAVQIGDPITQKRMTDFLLRARDEGLMTCLTDNGAGGLSSSVGEMAQDPGGAKLELSHAPLKYQGLQPWEIFISEAQERMTAAVSPSKVSRFVQMAREMGVEATDLGEYTEGPYLELFYEDRPVALLDMRFLHDGLPQMNLKAQWHPPEEPPMQMSSEALTEETLFRLLGRLDICSKEHWVRQYDHEVQGGSVIKPLCGVRHDGPSDAAVVRPVLDLMRGVAVSHGICPRYSDIDTYHMAACAVDEAMRNLVSTGADPDRVAALDNFCWCDPVESPSNPDGNFKLAQLVRAAKALKDICIIYRMPLVSGKDSMKNDYAIGATRISIPPTLLVTAVGQLDDVSLAVSMDAKNPGDAVYLVGTTWKDLGKTQYSEMYNLCGGSVPKLRTPEETILAYRWLHRAIKSGLVASCHDLSDGGLAVAAAETAFSGELGISLDLSVVPSGETLCDAEILFSETPGRLLVTVPTDCEDAFAVLMGAIATRIGEVTDSPHLRITGLSSDIIMEANINRLKEAWQKPLRFQEVTK